MTRAFSVLSELAIAAVLSTGAGPLAASQVVESITLNFEKIRVENRKSGGPANSAETSERLMLAGGPWTGSQRNKGQGGDQPPRVVQHQC